MTSAANRLRYFSTLPNTDPCTDEDSKVNSDWSYAQNECEKEGQSLITLYDQHDANFVKDFLVKCPEQSHWLGLKKDMNNTMTWSNGDPFQFNDSKVNIKPDEQQCEAIEDGEWKGFNCSDRKPFLCQKGKF